MKKRIISGLLTLCIIVSMFAFLLPVSESQVNAATASQNNIVARANYMYNATWVCQKTVSGWGGTFYAGSTYHVPYGQPIYSGSYVGFNNNVIDDSSINTYLAAAADANSIFYTGRSYYTGKQAPYYATDCSAFVSWCWGVSRKTTASIPNVSTNLGMATASNNYNLQLGDALNSNSAGHVVLVTGLSYDASGTITNIEITEQTPPQLKKSYYTPATLGSKYGSRYSIQRYYENVPNAPHSGSAPMGSFDEAKGGIGSVSIRGWALDTDDTGKSLDIYVSIGGPVFSENAQSTVVSANTFREDVNNTFGCGGNHGFDATIGTSLTGEQPVYIYAYDNDGSNDNTYLDYKTVYITPDTESPTVGEINIISSDNSKYTVSCNVSDNGFISRVYFPTWTEDNPDNKIWYEGFVFDGVAYCEIPISDFNGYNGKYYTHMYVYDSAGNSATNGNFHTTFNLPQGAFDEISESDGTISIRGWAFDKDAIDEATQIHVYVGDPGSADCETFIATADLERTDVDAVHNCGVNHGFETSVKTTLSGTQTVYVYAINKGNGGNVLIGSKEVTISAESVLPSISNTNILSSDEDSFTVSCEVSDNRKVKEVRVAVWPENNADFLHWYYATIEDGVATATIPISDFWGYNGKYIIHIYAFDSYDNSIGYPYETTYNLPIGSFDEITESDGTLHLRGWALDKDELDEPLEIHAYVGDSTSGNFEKHSFVADISRPDVAEFYNCSPNHGFEVDIKTGMAGTQDVYVYAINVGNGGNVFLGKKTVTITPETVKPSVSNARVISSNAEGFTVSCDVSDNRGVKKVNVAVWPENKQDSAIWYYATIENDVATVTIPVADFENYSGKYIIHIYAYDGHENFEAIAYETIFNLPIGSFDEIKDSQGAVYVKGWAFDGDTADEALFVDVYIGAPAGSPDAEYHRIKADKERPEIADFLGVSSFVHGYESIIRTSKRGEQTVYIYAVNTGHGGDVLLGSQVVTITNQQCGDANNDGEINILDVTHIQNILAGITNMSEEALAADVNKNGKLDIRDATYIQMYIAQMIEAFPITE